MVLTKPATEEQVAKEMAVEMMLLIIILVEEVEEQVQLVEIQALVQVETEE